MKTPKGWRFKSRNVVSDAELAAGLTTKDFIEIRQLAGDDHGHYENLYGDEKDMGPRGVSAHANRKFFRTSGLRLTPAKEGVRDLLLRREQTRFLRDEWPLILERIKALEIDPNDLPK